MSNKKVNHPVVVKNLQKKDVIANKHGNLPQVPGHSHLPPVPKWKKKGINPYVLFSFVFGLIIAGAVTLWMTQKKNIADYVKQDIQLIEPAKVVEMDVRIDLNNFTKIDPNQIKSFDELLTEISYQKGKFETEVTKKTDHFFKINNITTAKGKADLNEFNHAMNLQRNQLNEAYRKIEENWKQADLARRSREIASEK